MMELTVEILDQRLQTFKQEIKQEITQEILQEVDRKITEATNNIIKWVVGLVFASNLIAVAVVNFYTSAVALVVH